MENFDLTRLGLPQYMKDQATFDVFPRFAPDGYQPDRHRGMAQDGSSGGRPPLLGLLHQDDGRAQHQGWRRDPVELPRLRSAGISLGPVHVRQRGHVQGSFLLRGQRGQRPGRDAPRLAVRRRFPYRPEGLHAVGLLGVLRPRRLAGLAEADVESRSALRLRRAALGNAGSHELLGSRSAVARCRCPATTRAASSGSSTATSGRRSRRT